MHALKTNVHLRQLNMARNALSDVSMLHISFALKANSALQELSLRENKVTDALGLS